MIEGLFFDGVDTETAGAPIGGQDQLALFHFAHKAEAPLTLVQFAKARTEVTLNAAVIEAVPITGGHCILIWR